MDPNEFEVDSTSIPHSIFSFIIGGVLKPSESF
jgi:hypothetical protein